LDNTINHFSCSRIGNNKALEPIGITVAVSLGTPQMAPTMKSTKDSETQTLCESQTKSGSHGDSDKYGDSFQADDLASPLKEKLLVT